LQYISPDIAEIWKEDNHADSGYKVIHEGPLIMTGGDNASHAILTSNTVRYLAQFEYKQAEDANFIQYPTDDLFTIKGQVLKNIPKLKRNDDNIIESRDHCSYFVEYGGKEQNNAVPFHYLNEVVLFKVCKAHK